MLPEGKPATPLDRMLDERVMDERVRDERVRDEQVLDERVLADGREQVAADEPTALRRSQIQWQPRFAHIPGAIRFV